MIEELSIAANQSHWLISVFIVTSTLSMLLVPHLISKFSLHKTFNWSLILFIVASMIGANLNSLWPLILCRALQGIVMGTLSIVAIITLFEAYPIEKRGRAGAIFGMGVAMGPTLGPTLSGIIVDWWGWRATFYIPTILSFISLALCWKILPRKRVDTTKKLDITGFTLLTIIIFGFFTSVSVLSDRHWPGLLTTTLLGILALLTLLWWKHQRRCPEPLLDLTLFQHPIFNAVGLVSFVYGMGLWGSAFMLPLFLQQSLEMSVWNTGMVMLPSGLFLCLTLPFGGRLADSIAARSVVSLGLVSLSCSFVLLGLGVGHSSFIAIAGLIVLSRGLGLGLMIPSLDATATRALPGEKMTDGVAMMNFLRQLGGALSPTLLSLLLHWRIEANKLLGYEELPALQLAYEECLLGLGLLFALSLLAAWYLPRVRFSHQVIQ